MDEPDVATLSDGRWAGLWGRGSVNTLAKFRATMGVAIPVPLLILEVGIEILRVLGKVPEKRLVEVESLMSSTVPSTGLSGANCRCSELLPCEIAGTVSTEDPMDDDATAWTATDVEGVPGTAELTSPGLDLGDGVACSMESTLLTNS